MGRSRGGRSGGSRSRSSGSSRSFSSGGSRGFSGGMRSSGRTKSSLSSSRSSPSRGSTTKYWSTGRRPWGYYRAHKPGGRESLKILVKVYITILIALVIISLLYNMNTPSSLRSTVEREPLPMSMSTETSYYTDTLSWIRQPDRLISGMREFYQKTGVQPHLYIVDSIDGDSYPTNEKVEKWANEKYDELFEDEAHLLLIILDNGYDYGSWVITGKETKTVIDDEARGIILNYVDRYYSSDLDDEDMFSTVFSKSAESIMTTHESPWPKVILFVFMVSAGVIVVGVVLNYRTKKKEQELIENQQTIEILNTPLEKIDDSDEIDELADKYRD